MADNDFEKLKEESLKDDVVRAAYWENQAKRLNEELAESGKDGVVELLDIYDSAEDADTALQEHFPELEKVAHSGIVDQLKKALDKVQSIQRVVENAVGGAEELVAEVFEVVDLTDRAGTRERLDARLPPLHHRDEHVLQRRQRVVLLLVVGAGGVDQLVLAEPLANRLTRRRDHRHLARQRNAALCPFCRHPERQRRRRWRSAVRPASCPPVSSP